MDMMYYLLPINYAEYVAKSENFILHLIAQQHLYLFCKQTSHKEYLMQKNVNVDFTVVRVLFDSPACYTNHETTSKPQT